MVFVLRLRLLAPSFLKKVIFFLWWGYHSHASPRGMEERNMIKKEIKYRIRHALTNSGMYDISNEVGYSVFKNQNGKQRVTSDAVEVSPDVIQQAIANNEVKARDNQEAQEVEGDTIAKKDEQ